MWWLWFCVCTSDLKFLFLYVYKWGSMCTSVPCVQVILFCVYKWSPCRQINYFRDRISRPKKPKWRWSVREIPGKLSGKSRLVKARWFDLKKNRALLGKSIDSGIGHLISFFNRLRHLMRFFFVSKSQGINNNGNQQSTTWHVLNWKMASFSLTSLWASFYGKVL